VNVNRKPVALYETLGYLSTWFFITLFTYSFYFFIIWLCCDSDLIKQVINNVLIVLAVVVSITSIMIISFSVLWRESFEGLDVITIKSCK